MRTKKQIFFSPYFSSCKQKCKVQCPNNTCHCICDCIPLYTLYHCIPFSAKVKVKGQWCKVKAVAGVTISSLQVDSEFLFWSLSLTLTCHITTICQLVLKLCLKMQLKLLFLSTLWWQLPNISVVAKLTEVENTCISCPKNKIEKAVRIFLSNLQKP